MHTERLLLRPFEGGDLHALHETQSDEEVVRYLYHDARSIDEVRAVLARKIAGVTIAGEGDGLSAAVVLRETGQLVADISLWLVSFPRRASEKPMAFSRRSAVGSVVRPWRRSLASSATRVSIWRRNQGS